jgi:hypothetical protein
MTWIKTVKPKDDPKLREAFTFMHLYPPEYAGEVPSLKELTRESGGVSAVHSLLPETLKHVFTAYGSLIQPDLPLSRAQHEMIATVVSVANDCFY